MKPIFSTLVVLLIAATLGAAPASAGRVTVSGEVIDSWCYLTEIMYPLGSAHHQCAIWCAAGGIPTAILDDDGTVYIVLAFEGDGTGVANPSLLDIQSHRVTVEGEAFERDGMTYLVIERVVADHGIVNLTHDEYGIQPFGN